MGCAASVGVLNRRSTKKVNADSFFKATTSNSKKSSPNVEMQSFDKMAQSSCSLSTDDELLQGDNDTDTPSVGDVNFQMTDRVWQSPDDQVQDSPTTPPVSPTEKRRAINLRKLRPFGRHEWLVRKKRVERLHMTCWSLKNDDGPRRPSCPEAWMNNLDLSDYEEPN